MKNLSEQNNALKSQISCFRLLLWIYLSETQDVRINSTYLPFLACNYKILGRAARFVYLIAGKSAGQERSAHFRANFVNYLRHNLANYFPPCCCSLKGVEGRPRRGVAAGRRLISKYYANESLGTSQAPRTSHPWQQGANSACASLAAVKVTFFQLEQLAWRHVLAMAVSFLILCSY